ncbi:hypothetical protein BDF22DRAFT_676641 [Syncephalis plumigaleata]|nr:hypothetical protein BDF22DRAFT_676641 [Syncephalis plumigaleata]
MYLYKSIIGLVVLAVACTATPAKTAIKTADIVPNSQSIMADSTLPYTKCDPSAHYAFNIDQLNVDPLPIRFGSPLKVLLNGAVNHEIPHGSKVRVAAKLSVIGTKTFEADLCSAAQHLTVSGVTRDGAELFCFNTEVRLVS